MCGIVDVNFRCPFFSSDFSIRRKIVAGASIAIGIALAIIFALGIVGIIPGVNAKYPILALTIGTIGFLGVGFSLAGCKPRNYAYEVGDAVGELGKAVGKMGDVANQGSKPDSN